jgi:hypothetical protein
MQHDPSSFACRSTGINTLDDFDKEPTVASPDGRKSVQVTKGYKFRIVTDGSVAATLDFPDVSCGVEIGWSPDSSQFFISYSDGGAVGGYHVHLYRLIGNQVQEDQAPSLVAARFKTEHWCETRGNNLFFLNWTPDSKIVFLVAEVYPTSDCGKQMGQVQGYAVHTDDGTILRVFSEKKTDRIETSCRKSGRLDLPSR